MKKTYKETVTETLTKFNQAEYIAQFNKENYKHYHLKVSKKDEDVIAVLDSQPNKNAYIIALIRADIEKKQED